MTPADLVIQGEIVLDGTIIGSGDEAWFDSGIITSSLVRGALAMFDGDVVVRVNSAGGDPTEGEAIRAAFESHEGKVTAKVAGDAMSAASLMIMGADVIEMSAGSIMMIHDPSALTFGTADEHRKTAKFLDVLADTYAAVYAARCGKSAEDVRALMREEIYMSPAEAVAQGFADAITGQATADTISMKMIAASRERLALAVQMVSDHRDRRNGNPGASVPGEQAASGGQTQGRMAAKQEADMPEIEAPATETPAVPETPVAASAPVMQAQPRQKPSEPAPDRDAILMAERARVRTIRETAAPFLASGALMQGDVDALIEDGTPAADAAQRLLASMAAAQPVTARAGGGSARIERDETETRTEGMICALMGNFDGPGSQFRGLKLKSLAIELSGARTSFSENEAVRRGMKATTMMGGAHGVSDFAYITTEVLNRTLQDAYERRPASWQAVTGAPLSATDFRELAPVRFGGDLMMKTVKENGEYHEATLADEAEGLKVERRGRTINLTFEAVTNDDLGAFQRIAREFAISARIMESSMVWDLIRSNGVLKSDSKALFHSDHKNLAASGAALGVAAVGAARKAMWEQTAFGSKDKDDFLMIEPDTLIVPPALEMVALQFVSSIAPAKNSDANPYRETLSPVVAAHLGASAGGSDTAWYLISSDLPPVSHAFLEGFEAPTISTVEGMNPDVVKMSARHIFGAAVTEFRGSWKNPGS